MAYHEDSSSWIPTALLIIAIVAVGGMILACCGISEEDLNRTGEEIAELKTDQDGDGYCAHEKTCKTEGTQPGDCNDQDDEIFPGQHEGPEGDTPHFGDGIDNDCDSIVDEDAIDVDNDGDGYCEYTAACRDNSKIGDCDDSNPNIHPEADESINAGIDNDCDGAIDEQSVYFDDDSDGYCEQQCDHYSLEGGDCNDEDASVHPGAGEGEEMEEGIVGDGVDNDCDGKIDEGTLQFDNDGDGYCAAEVCTDEETKPGDCNDENEHIYPEATELHHLLFCDEEGMCMSEGIEREDMIVKRIETKDGVTYTVNDMPLSQFIEENEGLHFCTHLAVDDDCDGIADNNLPETDDDGDGYCEHEEKCRTPNIKPGDCDDANDKIHPGAREGVATEGGVRGDEIDNDCDGVVDEGTLYQDADGDGQRIADGDCADNNPLVYLDAPEWMDGLDNDCDRKVDESDGLAELPTESSQPDYNGTFYQYYPSEIYDERARTWSYDHQVSMAKIDWETGQITLLKSRESNVTLEPSDYKVESATDDELLISYQRSVDGGRMVDRQALIRFDQRRRPMRVALVIHDVPRPGVIVSAGRPIDGLARRGHISRTVLTTSPAGIPALKLVDHDPSLTALSFYQCGSDGCDDSNTYYGHFLMEPIVPEEVWMDKVITVNVDEVEYIDLDACRTAYSEASRNVGQTHLEKSFLAVQDTCTTPLGTKPLEFQLIFTR